MRRNGDDRIALGIGAADRLAGKINLLQLIAPEDEAFVRSKKHAFIGAVVGTIFEYLVGVAVVGGAGLIGDHEAARIGDEVYIFEILVVQVAVRGHLASLRMRLI